MPEDHEFARTAGRKASFKSRRATPERSCCAAPAPAVLPRRRLCSATSLRCYEPSLSVAIKSLRGQGIALEPAIEVDPLFARLPRSAELPDYPVWDDSLAGTALAQAVNA